MTKPKQPEPLNYTDTSRLIEAFIDWIHKGHNNKYNLELLLKLARNKRILFEMPDEHNADACQAIEQETNA